MIVVVILIIVNIYVFFDLSDMIVLGLNVSWRFSRLLIRGMCLFLLSWVRVKVFEFWLIMVILNVIRSVIISF